MPDQYDKDGKYIDPEDSIADSVLTGLTNIDVSCYACKHLWKDQGKCLAYPDGIPNDILTGETRHDKPLPEDRGIQFELK